MTETLDHWTARTILVRTCTVVTRRRTVLKTSASCLSILSSDSGCAPSRPVHGLVGGAVGEDPAVPLEGELASLPLQAVALWSIHTVVLASLVGPVSIGGCPLLCILALALVDIAEWFPPIRGLALSLALGVDDSIAGAGARRRQAQGHSQQDY